jgi:uncharacterized protein
MEYIVIAVVACGASLLTFYSGFGLGTLLTPAFVLWFPIDVAIAMTGIVHFLNNGFKFRLTYKHLDQNILWRFGLPAVIAAFLGAWLLTQLPVGQTVYIWIKPVTWPKIVLATLMIAFVILELVPKWRDMTFPPDKMWLGGILSGFFGGLAGFQGVLRSMFLVKSGLSKEVYIATGIGIACLIDISRLTTYFSGMSMALIRPNILLIGVATFAAFLGAYLGNLWIKKVTISVVEKNVSMLLMIFAGALLSGLL